MIFVYHYTLAAVMTPIYIIMLYCKTLHYNICAPLCLQFYSRSSNRSHQAYPQSNMAAVHLDRSDTGQWRLRQAHQIRLLWLGQRWRVKWHRVLDPGQLDLFDYGSLWSWPNNCPTYNCILRHQCKIQLHSVDNMPSEKRFNCECKLQIHAQYSIFFSHFLIQTANTCTTCFDRSSHGIWALIIS